MSAVARVEFRTSTGRILGYTRQVDDQWPIRTVDGRHATVDTRVEALLAGAAMADAAGGGGAPADPPAGLRRLISAWRETAADIDPGSERAPDVVHDPGAMRAETLRRCAAELESAIERAAEGGATDG